ncbi:MAG TPA: hypothetical protein VHJ20_23435 [Polyangia bacterium]|nr:hypothetical protein [Polyangia bacterium]
MDELATCGSVTVNMLAGGLTCTYPCGTCTPDERCDTMDDVVEGGNETGVCVPLDEPDASVDDGGDEDASEPNDAPTNTSPDAPTDTPVDQAMTSDAAGDAPVSPPSLCTAVPVRALSIPDSYSGTLSGPSKIATSNCWGQVTSGPDDVFTLHLDQATGVEIHAQLEPVASITDQTIVVGVRKKCADGGGELVCNVHRNQGTGALVHTILQPGDYLVTVDTFTVSQDGGAPPSSAAYSLTTSKFDFPPNVACAQAVEVTNGQMLTSQDASAGVDDLSRCDRLVTAKVIYYKATVPAGQTLMVKSTGRSAVRILASCDAATCLTEAKDNGTSMGATATWTNAGAAPTTVFIALGAFDASTSASYDISFAIAP